MENQSSDSLDLQHLIAALGGAEALRASAREHKAFRRPRAVKSACDLLRLLLLYGPGGGSFRPSPGSTGSSPSASRFAARQHPPGRIFAPHPSLPHRGGGEGARPQEQRRVPQRVGPQLRRPVPEAVRQRRPERHRHLPPPRPPPAGLPAATAAAAPFLASPPSCFCIVSALVVTRASPCPYFFGNRFRHLENRSRHRSAFVRSSASYRSGH